MSNPEQEAQDAFDMAALHLPSSNDIKKLSFAGLASLLSLYREGTAEYRVVERALKKHLAKDQAKINLPNILWPAGFSGMFALAGVVLGWHLPMSQTMAKERHTDNVQQSKNSRLDPQYMITRGPNPNAESIPAPVVPRTEKASAVDASNTEKQPTPVQSNEQPSN